MHPVDFSGFDFIEVFLHFRGKIDVYDVGKMLADEVGYNETEARGFKCLSVAFNVVSCDYRCDDGGVGTRSSDSVFFKRFDKGSFGVS